MWQLYAARILAYLETFPLSRHRTWEVIEQIQLHSAVFLELNTLLDQGEVDEELILGVLYECNQISALLGYRRGELEAAIEFMPFE